MILILSYGAAIFAIIMGVHGFVDIDTAHRALLEPYRGYLTRGVWFLVLVAGWIGIIIGWISH